LIGQGHGRGVVASHRLFLGIYKEMTMAESRGDEVVQVNVNIVEDDVLRHKTRKEFQTVRRT
jgi:hypothetical protein